MRWLRWTLLLLFVLVSLPVLALVGVLAWANTEGGQARLAALAAAQVPGLTIEGLHGPLPAMAGAARHHHGGRRRRVAGGRGGARLALDYSALLAGILRIEAWRRRGSRSAGRPCPPTRRRPSRSRRPKACCRTCPACRWPIALDRLAVGRMEIGAPVLGTAAAFAVSAMRISATGALQAALELRRLDAEGQAALDLRLSPAEDRLHAKASVREGPDGLVPALLGQPGQPLALDLDPGRAGVAAPRSTSRRASVPTSRSRWRGTVRAAPDGAAGAALDGTARLRALLPPDVAPLARRLAFSLRRRPRPDRRVDRRAAGPARARRHPLGQRAAEPVHRSPRPRAALDLPEAERFRPLVPETAALARGQRGGPDRRHLRRAIDRSPAAPRGARHRHAAGRCAARPGAAPRAPRRAARTALRCDAGGRRRQPYGARQLGRADRARCAALAAAPRGPRRRLRRRAGSRAPRRGAEEPTPNHLDTPAPAASTPRARCWSAAARRRRHAPASAPTADARRERRDRGPADLPRCPRPAGRPGAADRGGRRAARPGAAGRRRALDTAGPLFDGTAQLEAPDLAPLGALGRASPASPAGWPGRAFARAPSGEQGFDAKLDAPRLVYAGSEGSLRATAKGTPSALDWTVQGRAAEGSLSGRGKVCRDRWRLAGSTSKASKRRASARPCASLPRRTSRWAPMAACGCPGWRWRSAAAGGCRRPAAGGRSGPT